MSESASPTRGASPFSRGAVLAVVLVGFTAFLAMLYFIGAGDTGGNEGSGSAHASSRGLHGYAGLVELLEAEGYEVEKSRSREGFDTSDLLIVTPSRFTDAEELGAMLESREYRGPTLVILPKWVTGKITGDLSEEDEDKVRSDWVALTGVGSAGWTSELPVPLAFPNEYEELAEDEISNWSGLGLSGTLPTKEVLYTEQSPNIDPLIVDGAGHVLAFHVLGEEGSEYYENAHWVTFVTEPDLMNNYGLSDAQRAAAALAIVREAGYSDIQRVTIDMSLLGYGGSTNLLTLAFQPPFLAATLCLILAMLIVGWRAFLRFGPSATGDQEIAFGKRRLVINGAGLIVRAKRLGLLADPYVKLVERRLARMLGIAHPDAEAIDRALANRLPGEEPFSSRAARLHNAEKPIEILRAARALNDLTQKISGKLTK